MDSVDLNKPNTVKNLSSNHFSSDETSLLSKDFNFTVTHKRIPTKEITCAVDSLIWSHPTFELDEIGFAKILHNARTPSAYISKHDK